MLSAAPMTLDLDRTYPYYPALPYARRVLDKKDVSHVIIHETGVGVYKRRAKFPEYSPLELALHVYQHIMPFCAHFVVGPDGKVAQTLRLDTQGMHVGVKGAQRYRNLGEMSNVEAIPRWWRQLSKDEPDLVSCLTSGWRKKSVNAVSVGVELVSPTERGAPLPDEQVGATLELVKAILAKFPRVEYVTSHARIHPISRTAKEAAYDLPEKRWKQIKSSVSELDLDVKQVLV